MLKKAEMKHPFHNNYETTQQQQKEHNFEQSKYVKCNAGGIVVALAAPVHSDLSFEKSSNKSFLRYITQKSEQ